MVKTKIVEIGSMVPAFEEERLIILFRNEVGEILPGAIIVSPGEFPTIEVGDEIAFI